MTTEDGRTLHQLDFHTVQAPGEKVRMDVNGTTLLDPELGRPVKTDASGHIKVKVYFVWVTVPTQYTLRELADEVMLD